MSRGRGECWAGTAMPVTSDGASPFDTPHPHPTLHPRSPYPAVSKRNATLSSLLELFLNGGRRFEVEMTRQVKNLHFP